MARHTWTPETLGSGAMCNSGVMAYYKAAPAALRLSRESGHRGSPSPNPFPLSIFLPRAGSGNCSSFKHKELQKFLQYSHKDTARKKRENKREAKIHQVTTKQRKIATLPSSIQFQT